MPRDPDARPYRSIPSARARRRAQRGHRAGNPRLSGTCEIAEQGRKCKRRTDPPRAWRAPAIRPALSRVAPVHEQGKGNRMALRASSAPLAFDPSRGTVPSGGLPQSSKLARPAAPRPPCAARPSRVVTRGESPLGVTTLLSRRVGKRAQHDQVRRAPQAACLLPSRGTRALLPKPAPVHSSKDMQSERGRTQRGRAADPRVRSPRHRGCHTWDHLRCLAAGRSERLQSRASRARHWPRRRPAPDLPGPGRARLRRTPLAVQGGFFPAARGKNRLRRSIHRAEARRCHRPRVHRGRPAGSPRGRPRAPCAASKSWTMQRTRWNLPSSQDIAVSAPLARSHLGPGEGCEDLNRRCAPLHRSDVRARSRAPRRCPREWRSPISRETRGARYGASLATAARYVASPRRLRSGEVSQARD